MTAEFVTPHLRSYKLGKTFILIVIIKTVNSIHFMYQSIPIDMVDSLLFSTFATYFCPFFFAEDAAGERTNPMRYYISPYSKKKYE